MAGLSVSCGRHGLVIEPLKADSAQSVELVPEQAPPDWTTDVNDPRLRPDQAAADCRFDGVTAQIVTQAIEKRAQGECGADDGGRKIRISLAGKTFIDSEYQSTCSELLLANLRVERERFHICAFVPFKSVREALEHGVHGPYGYPLATDLTGNERQTCSDRRFDQPMTWHAIRFLGQAANRG